MGLGPGDCMGEPDVPGGPPGPEPGGPDGPPELGVGPLPGPGPALLFWETHED